MDGSAPKRTKVSSTRRFLPEGSFTDVFSLPSEKVPAPPSPNCTLLLGLSMPLSQNFCTSQVLFSTRLPRSITIGRKPASANIYAQNRPAGPAPAITGRLSSGIWPHAGIMYSFSLYMSTDELAALFTIASSLFFVSSISTATEYV